MKTTTSIATALTSMIAISLSGCHSADENAEQESREVLEQTDQAIETCDASTENYTFTSSSPYVIAKLGAVEIAHFTVGAYTVNVKGYANRSFPTKDTDDSDVNVTHDIYVRTLAAPFATTMSDADKTAWLRAAREANCRGDDDVLAIAQQYTEGAPETWSGKVRIMGDADYKWGCDFHDYLCTSYTPPDGSPHSADLACQESHACPNPSLESNTGLLDCSGFMRMVYSYRNNFAAQMPAYTATIPASRFRYPLSTSQAPTHLPRDSRNQYRYGTGVKVVPFRITSAPTQAELDALRPGDLMFFNLKDTTDKCCEPATPNSSDKCCDDGITHVGMYVGTQSHPNKPLRYRLINSRDSLNGPTMRGTSFINNSTNSGSSYSGWSSKFRAARRL